MVSVGGESAASGVGNLVTEGRICCLGDRGRHFLLRLVEGMGQEKIAVLENTGFF